MPLVPLTRSHFLACSAGRWPWLAVNSLNPRPNTSLSLHVYIGHSPCFLFCISILLYNINMWVSIFVGGVRHWKWNEPIETLLLWSGHFLNVVFATLNIVFNKSYLLTLIKWVCVMFCRIVFFLYNIFLTVNIIHGDRANQCCTELSVIVHLEESGTIHKKCSLGKNIMIIWLFSEPTEV